MQFWDNLFLSGFISSLPQLAWEKRLCCCCCYCCGHNHAEVKCSIPKYTSAEEITSNGHNHVGYRLGNSFLFRKVETTRNSKQQPYKYICASGKTKKAVYTIQSSSRECILHIPCKFTSQLQLCLRFSLSVPLW